MQNPGGTASLPMGQLYLDILTSLTTHLHFSRSLWIFTGVWNATPVRMHGPRDRESCWLGFMWMGGFMLVFRQINEVSKKRRVCGKRSMGWDPLSRGSQWWNESRDRRLLVSRVIAEDSISRNVEKGLDGSWNQIQDSDFKIQSSLWSIIAATQSHVMDPEIFPLAGVYYLCEEVWSIAPPPLCLFVLNQNRQA